MEDGRILVVDSEEFNRYLMVEVLTRAGFVVDEADYSEATLDLLRADGYKVLVMDTHLPGKLDGVELVRRAHNSDPELCLLVIAGRPDAIERLRKTGIRMETLRKPFKLTRLVEIVQQLAGIAPCGHLTH